MAVPFLNQIPPKNALATLDYEFDWTAWLASGETIASATVTVPTGITLYTPASVNGGVVVFWLSGGTAMQTYSIACTVVTSAGRTDVRSFLLSVK
jgi:hypothetical protein